MGENKNNKSFTLELKTIWKYTTFGMLILSGYLLHQLHLFRKNFDPKGKKFFADVKFHSIRIIFYSMLVILFRFLMKFYTENKVLAYCEAYKPKELELYRRKIKTIIPNLTWYSFLTIFGYGWIAYDHPCIPKSLGGSMIGSKNFLETYPSLDLRPLDYTYFYLQFGSKLYSFLNTLILERNLSAFWELILHHYISILLMIICLFGNITEIGIVVLLIHDTGDLALNLGYTEKYLLPEKYKFGIVRVMKYINMAIFFIFFRVVIQPVSLFSRILNSLSYGITNIIPYDLNEDNLWRATILAYFIFGVLLILYVMNLYWSMLLFKILFSAIYKGNYQPDHLIKEKNN